MSWPPHPLFFALLAHGLALVLLQKTVAALHFGSRRWPRWVWAGLSVGLCPWFLLQDFWLGTGPLSEVAFAAAAVFFSVKFLEDGDWWDAGFAAVVVVGQLFLNLKIPVFEWVVLVAVAVSAPPIPPKRGEPRLHARLRRLLWFSPPLGGLGGASLALLALPFCGKFAPFLPLCLFFLKKTDLAPLPKKALAAASLASVAAALFWPSQKETALPMAFLGLAVVAFPVFERGLLYGLVFLKKRTVWSLVAFFALAQLAAFFFFLK